MKWKEIVIIAFLIVFLLLIINYFVQKNRITKLITEIEDNQSEIHKKEADFNKKYQELQEQFSKVLIESEAKSKKLEKSQQQYKSVIQKYEEKIKDIKPVSGTVTPEKYNNDIKNLKLTISAYKNRVYFLELQLKEEQKSKLMYKKKFELAELKIDNQQTIINQTRKDLEKLIKAKKPMGFWGKAGWFGIGCIIRSLL